MKTKQKQIKKTKTVHAKVVHHAKRILVPHKGNAFRPHLIRVHGLVAVLIIAILAQAVYSVTTTGNFQVLGRTSDIQTFDLLTDTNKERAAQNLGELQLSDQLSQAAFLKAQDMLANNY